MRSVLVGLVVLAACSQAKETVENKVEKLTDHKAEIARRRTKDIAFEAFPQWAMMHPDKQCPDSPRELGEFLDDKALLDPWGRPYKLLCGPTLPAGAKGLVAVSAGEDGKDGTADDVRSTD